MCAVGITTLLVAHTERDSRAVRKRARALLRRVSATVRRRGRRKRAGDRVLVGADLEAHSVPRNSYWSESESIVDRIGEQCSRPSARKNVHGEDQLTWPGRAGE